MATSRAKKWILQESTWGAGSQGKIPTIGMENHHYSEGSNPLPEGVYNALITLRV